jgi:parallel beta-helix repeat protein
MDCVAEREARSVMETRPMREDRAMSMRFVRGPAGAVLAALVTMAWVSGAAAAVPLAACGTLDQFNQTYNLTADLHASGGDCLVVAADRITINLKGHSIIQDNPTPFGAGVTDGGIARNLTVVKNGAIIGFVFGIELDSSTRNEVRNVTTEGNILDGIFVGDRSLVKDCTSVDNGLDAILGGDGVRGKERVQVQNCEASGNGANGIRVGNRCLVTANTAEENLEDGIATGGSCTVSRNTASDNDDDGIDVGHEGEFDGSKSLVTANLTDDNFDVGNRVKCPSTVTNNMSSGNGQNYLFDGAGCFLSNNQ